MPKLFRKNLSFQAGEISPRFYGRSDTEIYSKGLATAENVFIDKRGGAFRRPGFEHSFQITGDDARVFTNQINVNRFDTILLHDLEMIILAPGANFSGPNLLSNGNFFDEGTDWTVLKEPVSSQVVFAPGYCQLTPEPNAPQLLVNPDFAAGAAGWTERVTNQSNVTFLNDQCTLAPRGAGGTPTDYAGIFQEMTTDNPGEVHTLRIAGAANTLLAVKVGTGEDEGSYYDADVSVFPAEITFTPAASPFTVTLDCYNPNVNAVLDAVTITDDSPRFASISQEVTVTALQTALHEVFVIQTESKLLTIDIGTTAGASDIFSDGSSESEIVFEFVPNNPTYWVTVRGDADLMDSAILTFVGTVAEAEANEIGQLMVAPWTEAQLPLVHIVESPRGDTIYFLHPNVPPQKLVYSFATDTYSTLVAVPFVSPPAAWVTGNYPATGEYFQGRLWLAGTPNQRQDIWASVSASPEDFTVTAQQDSSSLEFSVQEFGRIKWMLGTKTLLVGTGNGEHILSSEGPVITPVDFKIERQSSFGSNDMQAKQVGEKVFYSTPDGRKLRAMSYEWQENNWLSQDLTFASEHITEGAITHMAWAQNPDAILALTLKSGGLVLVTYDRTAETVGWTRFIAAGFNAHDIAVGSVGGRDRLVLVGQRPLVSPGMMELESNRDVDQFLDSYSHISDPDGTDVIDGLDHLEGQVVQVIVDEAVDPPKVVIGGQVTADRVGTELYAGIQIKSKIVTLPPDVPQDQIRSWKKRWNKVWALMYQSKQPVINGIRPPDRSPSTPMDTVEPNVDTIHYKTINLGWDDFGQITIEEDLPVAMNVLAIYGEMGTETLK